MFVVGYSFRDEHIRQILWEAASKNSGLLIFVVDPDAWKIYKDRLRYFPPKKNETEVKSPLAGRVVCLPFRFENVLPFLWSEFLQKARSLDELTDGVRRARLAGKFAASPIVGLLDVLLKIGHVEEVRRWITHESDVLEFWNELRPPVEAIAAGLASALESGEDELIYNWDCVWRNFISLALSTPEVQLLGEKQDRILLGFPFRNCKYWGNSLDSDVIEPVRRLIRGRLRWRGPSKRGVYKRCLAYLRLLQKHWGFWRGGEAPLVEYIAWREHDLRESSAVKELKQELVNKALKKEEIQRLVRSIEADWVEQQLSSIPHVKIQNVSIAAHPSS